MKKNNNYDIILFDFFMELKKVGIELDLNQYQSFIRLLTMSEFITEANTAKEKRASLLILCKTMWLTKKEHQPKFEDLFGDAYDRLAALGDFYVKEEPKNKKADPKSLPEIKGKNPIIPPSTTGDEEGLKDEKPIPDIPISKKTNKEERDVYLNFGEGKGNVDDSINEDVSLKETSFIFSDDKHLPISTRKTKQIWKKLKQEIDNTTSTKINIKKTIDRFAKDNFFHKIEFETEKKSSREMILLIDHRGAMIAFEDWIEQLIDIINSIAGNQLEVYYFYNTPLPVKDSEISDYRVFETPIHLNATLLSEIASKMKKDSDVIIFSDAGVLDQKMDYNKVGIFFDVLKIFKRRTKNMLWINPFEKERWKEGVTPMLTSFMPMVSYTEKGMKEGIKILMK